MDIINQPILDAAGNTIGYASGTNAATVAASIPTPKTPAPATPATINSSILSPSSPIPYTSPNPTPAYPVGSLDTSTPTPPAALTPAQGQAQDLTSVLEGLNQALLGKSAYQTEQNTAAGVDTAQASITDLSAQLKGLQNEASAIPLNLQNEATGRGITADGLAPIQSGQLRDNAVKSLTVSTLLQAAQGNLANAQAQADKAVAQKYDPIQEEITAATNNLNLILNSPEYSREDKAQAQQQLDLQNARQDSLDKAKADATAVNQVAITAAQYIKNFKPTTQYPSAAVALNAISSAKSAADATAIAAQTSLTAPAKINTQVVNAGGRTLLINSDTGATISDLGASSAVSGTAAERAAGAVSNYSSAFVPGATTADGTPIIDTNGFVNPAAFKAAIADAPANGLSRKQFLQAFGYLLYAPGGKIDPSYGLTPAEEKLVEGTLPATS